MTGLSFVSQVLAVIRLVVLPSAVILAGNASFTSFAAAQATVITSTVPFVSPVDSEDTTAVPALVPDCSITVATPPAEAFSVVSSNVPEPATLKVTVLVALVTVASPVSHTLAVISDVDDPSAVIDNGLAVFTSFTGFGVVCMLILSLVSPADAPVTTAVPVVAVERMVTVALPDTAFLTVVPVNVPSPDTEKVNSLAAVSTLLSHSSHTRPVIIEVLEPSATIDSGVAVHITFAGPVDSEDE